MSFAIQNMEGKHLGFLLFSGNGNSGDCIFRSLPSEREQFDSSESELLFNLQNSGEFDYSLSAGATHISQARNSASININSGLLNINGVKFKLVQLERS